MHADLKSLEFDCTSTEFANFCGENNLETEEKMPACMQSGFDCEQNKLKCRAIKLNRRAFKVHCNVSVLKSTGLAQSVSSLG